MNCKVYLTGICTLNIKTNEIRLGISPDVLKLIPARCLVLNQHYYSKTREQKYYINSKLKKVKQKLGQIFTPKRKVSTGTRNGNVSLIKTNSWTPTPTDAIKNLEKIKER